MPRFFLLIFVLALTDLMSSAFGAVPPPASTGELASVPADQTIQWPMFRGPASSGVAHEQDLPDHWNATDQPRNLLFKIAIPGHAHSSPIVWGDRLYLTTAVSLAETESEFRFGLYGSGVGAADRDQTHRFQVLAIDKKSGEILWERTVHEGTPRAGRHLKATYANASPATDGDTIVAYFASEGLYALSSDGALRWKKDLGIVATSAYLSPGLEWGASSSPVIYKGKVFMQVDRDGPDDILLALDLETGEAIWKTPRDEHPSWGTPAIFEHTGGVELVTNAARFIRGYDPRTGAELWRLGGSSMITAPTPVSAGDLMIVSSGRRPVKPIFAIRGGARGEITLGEGLTSNRHVAWRDTGHGPDMPTPIVLDDRLYVLENNGIMSAYRLADGEVLYRERLQDRGLAFSASPVAADGKIYLASEDGDVYVVRASEKMELVAVNPMGEVLMATPAISEETLFVRGFAHLFAISRTEPADHGQ